MTDKGRAAFNARHLRHGGGHAKGESGTTGDRLRLLEEMMRELEEEWARHHAKKNPNIVLEDTHLNKSYMFDATTEGWKTPKSVDEVVAYGDDRAARVGRKITARSYETTTLVVHLPRTLCKEVPDYYPVCDDDGNPQYGVDGQPLMRSRWVASDREKANRYLMEATEWLADNVLPGGREAVHGFNLQHDESTPHVQIMADTFAEHPNKPGVLRVEASQTWGSHRDVRYPEGHPQAGQQMGGNQKMRMYQQGLREHMHGLGYEVELDVSERADESLNKDRYAAEDDARRVLEADREKYTADAQLLGVAQKNFYSAVTAFEADVEEFRIVAAKVSARERDVLALSGKLDEVEQELHEREVVVAGREEAVKAEEDGMPEIKRKARVEGYRDGKVEGQQAAREVAEDIRTQAIVEAQQITRQAAEAAQQVRHDIELEAEKKHEQAELDAATTRAAAGEAMAEAETTLTEAWRLLRAAQDVELPQIHEVDFRRQMNVVDADFLDRLCEKHPKIAKSRERYRDRRHREVLFGTPQQREALGRTVGQAEALIRKRFETGPPDLLAGRQGGNEQKHQPGPSGP